MGSFRHTSPSNRGEVLVMATNWDAPHTPGYTIASRLEPGLPCRSYVRFDWQRHPPEAIQATKGGLHRLMGMRPVWVTVPLRSEPVFIPGCLSRARPGHIAGYVSLLSDATSGLTKPISEAVAAFASPPGP